MNLRPLQDRVLIRRIEASDKTESGLYIPQTAKERPIEGEVIAVGPGRRLDNGSLNEPRVKPGDRVLFGKYAGTEIQLQTVEHLVVREDEILGVIETS